MIDRLTTFQKIRIWLSDFSFMRKPLRWFDAVCDKVNDIFSSFGVYMRYIALLFLLTLLFIFLKIIYRYFINWHRVSFSDFSDIGRMRYWQRYAQVEEAGALSDAISLFEEVKRQGKPKKATYLPAGVDLFHLVMQSVGQGLSDNEILKILPSKYSLIDVVPLIESIRGFRDLAAQKILEPKSRQKREYARALKELSQGKPEKAANLMRKELMVQQKVLINLKDNLLRQYAKKEAAKLSLHLALILGVYDTRLADKAYQRAIELNPKDSRAQILYGRFRQRSVGSNDKVMERVFLNLAKGVDKTLQNYMLNYAIEMIRKTEVRNRLDEIRTRFQDEKERYNESVQIERLKVREALKLARIRSIAQEERVR
ncbi:MAG: hypothetical protein E7013_02410 [Alphaproteobacteria bacterium]|nr:hypothetical protein [Alphaproteobacteria bacterium]